MIELLLIFLIILSIIIYSKVADGFSKNSSEIKELKNQIDAILKNKECTITADTAVVEEPKTEIVKEAESEPVKIDKPLVVAEKPSYFETRKEVDWNRPVVLAKEAIPETEVSVEAEEPIAPTEQPTKKNRNYEKIIGGNLFGKIGIIVFVIGIGLFVKYAISENWISEIARTVLGFFVGSALLFVSERLHKKYRTFSSLLAGGAFAVFYLIIAIAFHYYQLFSQPVAFVLLVGVTVFMSILSVLYDRRELAAISLVGGFLAPFLVSSGDGSYITLFTYIAILNIGMFGLSIYKKWSELVVISFAFTYCIMGLYLFNSDLIMNDSSVDYATEFSNLLLFATLFYFIFLLPIMHVLKNSSQKINRILLSVVISNNFIYLGLGVLFLQHMSLSFKAVGLLSLFIALVNLSLAYFLRKRQQEKTLLTYAIIGLVLTFVSVTVPLQLDGHYITLFWASEMVLLLWLYIKSRMRIYESASLILLLLTLVSYLIDISYSIEGYYTNLPIFLNTVFITNIYTGLMSGVFAYLLASKREQFLTTRYLRYKPWNAIMTVSSAIILYYTFVAEFYMHLKPEVVAEKTVLLFSVVSILGLSVLARKRFPITAHLKLYALAMGVSVLLLIVNSLNVSPYYTTLFNLLGWVMVAVVVATLYYISRMYYCIQGVTRGFTIYLNVIASLALVALFYSFLQQMEIKNEFGTGLSIALAVAGFVQMGLGMRLNIKLLRIISFVTFGIVLVKLLLIDLWAMATIGKIIVFVLLGLMLLVLSFFYQKKKDVLYKNDDDEK